MSAVAQGASEDAHHHVIICHRTGSESNPYVVINIPFTAWTEAHSPGASPAHPTLNGRDDIMLQDPAPGPGTKNGFTKEEDCPAGGPGGGDDTPGGDDNPGGDDTPSGDDTPGGADVSGADVSGGGTGGTTGGTTGGAAGAQATGELPFTGLAVWIPLLAGIGLFGTGYVLLRWKARTSA
jgi:hypothetical protein